MDIATESESGQARERYLAERDDRAVSEQPAAETPEAAEASEAPAVAPAEEIDAELIRRLEEFRRERLGSEGG